MLSGDPSHSGGDLAGGRRDHIYIYTQIYIYIYTVYIYIYTHTVYIYTQYIYIHSIYIYSIYIYIQYIYIHSIYIYTQYIYIYIHSIYIYICNILYICVCNIIYYYTFSTTYQVEHPSNWPTPGAKVNLTGWRLRTGTGHAKMRGLEEITPGPWQTLEKHCNWNGFPLVPPSL